MSRLTNWFNQQIRFHPGSPPEVQSEFISIRLESQSPNAYSIHSSTQHNAERLLKHIEGVYRWLPLGTIVNNRVLVVHGGISDSTDLDLIRSLDRGKYVSLLRPPGTENIDKVEWKQVSNVVIVKEWRMPLYALKSDFWSLSINGAKCTLLCGWMLLRFSPDTCSALLSIERFPGRKLYFYLLMNTYRSIVMKVQNLESIDRQPKRKIGGGDFNWI